MICIKRISEVKQGECDITLAIVRSMKTKSDWIQQEVLLSPSPTLFYKYLDLKKAGQWGTDSFQNIYVPQFLRELKDNKASVNALNAIYCSEKKKSIALCCFCTDESLCHRSIIAGLLQGAGSDVRIETDYSKYYDLYKKL